MPNKLQKYLQDYLSKIKKPPPQIPFPSRKWIRSGCKHPKTLSFAVNRDQKEANNNDDAASLSDIDQFLFENFRSLYLRDDGDDNDERRVKEDRHAEDFWDKTLHLKERRPDNETDQNSGGVLFESPRFNIDPPAVDLCGSHRFFVSPGRASSSVMEEARTSTTTTSEDLGSSSISTPTLNDSATTLNSNNNDDAKDVTLPNDCIAVLTYSPSPYDDFQRSMHEVVEARLRHHAKVDWNFMEELLFCYLNLNEKKSYRFILSAFADLVVDLRQNSGRVSERSSSSSKF
ncbi:transcription repressor OFP14 [Pyrus x bretschneideri]|uniref:transcription repressor OFP14 n=1 Tax=Pyrus x bretschneideri TaxID=225117 RepID=UPI00202E7DFA|nr:transcription repressor OFP14 [Pyrus x bretschneideri]